MPMYTNLLFLDGLVTILCDLLLGYYCRSTVYNAGFFVWTITFSIVNQLSSSKCCSIDCLTLNWPFIGSDIFVINAFFFVFKWWFLQVASSKAVLQYGIIIYFEIIVKAWWMRSKPSHSCWLKSSSRHLTTKLELF